MSNLVNVSEMGHYAVCMLTLPQKRNPLSAAMRAELLAALEELRPKKQIKSVVLTGGGSAFCSGMDLEALASQATLTPAEHLADSQSLREFFEYIAAYPKPTVAAVNGPAVAGGCALALLCDVTLASAEATFCFSEVKIGFVPAMAGVYLERLVGPKKACELLLTGRTVDADEAKVLGLVNEVVPAAGLLDCAAVICKLFSENGAEALRRTKELLVRQSQLPLKEALDLAVEVNARARASPECQEGVKAFLEKRPPQW